MIRAGLGLKEKNRKNKKKINQSKNNDHHPFVQINQIKKKSWKRIKLKIKM